MPTTPLGITYPQSTDHTRLWEHLQALAESVDTLLTGQPTVRKATEVLTATSATFTSETVIHSVTASLVAGKVYWVTLDTQMRSTVASTDRMTCRIREDGIAGNQLQDITLYQADTLINVPFHLEGEYTATATGAKTFVATGLRLSGSGTIVRNGGASQPSFLKLDLIR